MNQKMTIPPELEGEYTIRVMDMPLTSPGFVMYDDDDHANIYLNARYNRETNEGTADHELTHVVNDDIHNDDPIEVIEARADGLPIPLKSIPRLMRARDLIPPSPSLPDQKKETPVPPPTEEDASSVPIRRPSLSPHQATVLLHAISDLDAWFFRDNQYDY